MTRLDEQLTPDAGVYLDNAEKIDSCQTPYQLIEVWATPTFGKLMRIDGANMTSERDEFFYHESLIHPAAITHSKPETALIIGGGDGGAAEELLKHKSVARVVLCELDAGVVSMARRHFAAMHRNVFDDARLALCIGDGMAFVHTTETRFDLIYLDLTDPVGAAAALYTAAFFAACKKILTPHGALVLHLGAPFMHAPRVRSSVHALAGVFRRVAPYFVAIPSYGGLWGFAVASDTLDPRSVDARTVDARLAERGIDARQFYEGTTHVAMLAVPPYVRALLRA